MTSRRTTIQDAALSIATGAAFLILALASPSIAGGDDAYRHVKFASRLMSSPAGALADPWRLLYFWPRPIDVWFGYHLLLAPFTSLVSLILAAKIFSASVVALIAFVFLKLLDEANAVWRAGWLVLALCGSTTFLYRATLARPFLFSLLLILLATYLTLRGRPVQLALVSALHALSYSVFFLVALGPAAALLFRRDRRTLGLCLACAGGIALGLAVNPFFPENVRFCLSLARPVTTGIQYDLKVGGELRPLSVWWLAAAGPVVVVWVLAALRTIVRRSAGTVAWIALTISLVTLAMSVRVARTFDQFVPFAVWFAAAALSPWIAAHRKDARYLAALVLLVCAVNVIPAYRVVTEAPSVFAYRQAAESTLRRGQDTVVFNTQWEQYPFLYFWNSESRYVNGIDPTFLFLNNRGKFWLWRHLADDQTMTCGQPECTEAAVRTVQAALQDFGASFIVASTARNPRLIAHLRNNPEFREICRNAEVTLFEVLQR